MKKFVVAFIVMTLLLGLGIAGISVASVNKPLANIGKGLDNIVYGDVEVPDNMTQTNSKGSPAFEKCTSKTNDDVGRGIARVVGGVWQVLTFWYPQDEQASK